MKQKTSITDFFKNYPYKKKILKEQMVFFIYQNMK